MRIRYRAEGDRVFLRIEDRVEDESRVWRMLALSGAKIERSEDPRALSWRRYTPREAFPKLARAAAMARAELLPEEGEAPVGTGTRAREAYEKLRPLDVASLIAAAKSEPTEGAERALHDAAVSLAAWAREHDAYKADAKADVAALEGALARVRDALHARRESERDAEAQIERALLKGVAAEDAWRAHEALRRLREAAAEVRFEAPREAAPVPDPIPGFTGRLRPYQREGVEFLVSRRLNAILADEMGLGKTVMAIAAVLAADERAFIVAPASVVYNWADEVERFAGERALVWHAQRLEGPPGARFLVTTYDSLRSFPWTELREEIESRPVLVLDEAHLIRNAETQRAALVRALPQKRRVLLTGTPLVNSIEDTYELLNHVAPGKFGSREGFREAWLVDPELFNRYAEVRAATAAILQKAARELMLRRRKADVLPDLPPRTIGVKRHDLAEDEMRAYRQLEAGAAEALANPGGATTAQVFAAIHALRHHVAKSRVPVVLARVRELLEAGESVVVYAHYLEPLRGLKEALGGEAALLEGATAPKERQRLAQALGRDGKLRVLLAQMEAGGLGLNLTGARHVLFLHFGWTPAAHAQAMDRVHRIGQDQPVFVEFFVTPGTIDDRLARILLRKQADQNLVLAETADVVNEGALLRLLAEDARDHVTRRSSP